MDTTRPEGRSEGFPDNRPYQQRSSNYRGRKPYNPNHRQEYRNQHRGDSNYPSNNYIQPRDNDSYQRKSRPFPETTENTFANDHVPQRPKPPVDRYRSRTAFVPRQNDRTCVPSGREMLYQSGRLPTGMYVNRNVSPNDDNISEEDATIPTEDSSMRKDFTSSKIPKAHPLLKTLPSRSNNSHVIVPFVNLNSSGKSSTKKSTGSEKTQSSKFNKTMASATTSTALSDNGNGLQPRQHTREEIKKEAMRVKQEIMEDIGIESYPQPPSVHESEPAIPGTSNTPDSVFNQSINDDYTPQSLRRNQHGVNLSGHQYMQYIPDPNGEKHIQLLEFNTKMAELKEKKKNLMSVMKQLMANLTRAHTELEIVEFQMDEVIYKTTALHQ